MENKCKSCGGRLIFNPDVKGDVCESCGNILPIEYDYSFEKKDFSSINQLDHDELSDSLKTIKCDTCGASVMLDKHKAQSTCPYCGNNTVTEQGANELMYIDSIVPFSFGKAVALSKFKNEVNKRFFADKKIFKNITEKDIYGAYINAFVFDMGSYSDYVGVLSYEKSSTDKDGSMITHTVHVPVSGEMNKDFKNITVEANFNLNQQELYSVMPFSYEGAVKFKPEFMNGYMLEYKDKVFQSCVKEAENIIKRRIKDTILRYHNCDNIVSLKLNTTFTDKRYNYCLLPVYFVSTTTSKGKKYKALMNGQTGKVGHLPNNIIPLLIVFLVLGLIGVGIVALCIFL